MKDGRWDDILQEIRMVKEACAGRLLKVIVETCFLTEEKIRMCGIVTDSGADYIKTSTGFGGQRRHPGGCGALCPTHRASCEDQGCRRDRGPARCPGVYRAGGIPSGDQPDCQGRQGHGGMNMGTSHNEAQGRRVCQDRFNARAIRFGPALSPRPFWKPPGW